MAGYSDLFLYSNLALAFRLPAKFTVMPSAQYRYTQNDLISAKIRIEKTMGRKAYFYFQYEKLFRNDLNMAELGLRYDFSFAQTGATFRQSNSRSSFIQYARGSLISDPKTKYIAADNRTNVGRGGITIIPYLDINSNGGRDPGEPRASGLNIHSNSGRIIRNEKDTTIRIIGLEPYTSCFIELDQGSFESISWRLPVKTLSVRVDPDILKVVEIPISVAGEAYGTVLRDYDGQVRGQGRIIMRFYNEFNELAGRTLSEEDGYYNYLGLAAGEYIVRPDSGQVRNLRLKPVPEFRKFTVKPGREGDLIPDLDFVLKPFEQDSVRITEEPALVMQKADTVREKPVVEPLRPVLRKDTTYMIVHEVTQELVTVGEDGFAIQLGAFRRRSNAETLRKNLETMLGKRVEIIVENDLYKVRITGMTRRSEVEEAIGKLQDNGIEELWLITIRAQQKQWMLIEKTDTIARITEVLEGGKVTTVTPDLAIQVGAFRRQDLADAMMKRIAAVTGKPVIIIPEDGYYKVRVTGFESNNELQNMLPVLRKLGLNDIWVPGIKVQPEIAKPAEAADSLTAKPKIIIPPVEVRPDTAKVVSDTAAVKPVEMPVVEPVAEVPVVEIPPEVIKPKISLHVGEFRKRSQALKAQKKVVRKFDVPVDIFMRWDSYHLVITGFHDREETFMYYPELAGMGYTNIYVIQEK